MEGQWRAVAAALGVLVWSAVAGTGCGGASSDATESEPPQQAFAPVVQLASGERYRPMSARWFVERSVLRFAEDQGCPDLEVAVGRTLPELRKGDTNWIFYPPLSGRTWAYWRTAHDANCDYSHVRAYADQHVRPHDRQDRPRGVAPGEGFYLDLVDARRGGPGSPDEATTYYEWIPAGRRRIRMTYWMLFGMHAPPGRPDATHEGDWERVDVLLERGAGGYEPRAVRLGAIDAEGHPATPHDVPWRSLHTDGTHPVLTAARGSHELAPASDADCDGCTSWKTWQHQAPVREELWHGFGGAWGDLGPTGATTGPLGPHGEWVPTSKH